MITEPTETEERVRIETGATIREILREPELFVAPEHELRDELGLDSADLAELVVSLEQRLGVPLPDDTFLVEDGVDPFATFESLTRAVTGAMASAQG